MLIINATIVDRGYPCCIRPNDAAYIGGDRMRETGPMVDLT